MRSKVIAVPSRVPFPPKNIPLYISSELSLESAKKPTKKQPMMPDRPCPVATSSESSNPTDQNQN
jgi:hypothetical protein